MSVGQGINTQKYIVERKPKGNYHLKVRGNRKGGGILYVVFRGEYLQHSKIRDTCSILFNSVSICPMARKGVWVLKMIQKILLPRRSTLMVGADASPTWSSHTQSEVRVKSECSRRGEEKATTGSLQNTKRGV